MSSKRSAENFLSDVDENCDKRQENVKKRKFPKASEDVLKKRIIKKAHRRKSRENTRSSGSKAYPDSSSSTDSEAHSNDLQGYNQKSSSQPDFSVTELQNVKPADNEPSLEKKHLPEESATSDEETTEKLSEDESTPLSSQDVVYGIHIAALNKSVKQWIEKNIAKDPICDLSPIFQDYVEHLVDIEEAYGKIAFHPNPSFGYVKENLSKPEASEIQKRAKPEATQPKKENSKQDTTPLWSTYAPSPFTTSPFKGFTTTQSKLVTGGAFRGFQFIPTNVGQTPAVAPSAASCSSMPLIEREYKPPQPEKPFVEEKDSIYTVKCKLFYVHDGAYTERGVGHLHLKPIPSSTKTQLVIRADTPLGNLLLNIVLNPAIPLKKQGKNNVCLSCIPNPVIDETVPDKIVPLLIRVKTSEEADELMEIIEQNKKETTE